MTSVTRSAKKAKDAGNSSSSTKCSGGKAVCGRGSPVSRPELNDVSTLRSRESVVKRREPSCSCSSSELRKSMRLENRSLTASPSKNTLSSEEKRSMPSPPSKCERGNKQHCSSSSNGKRFEKESGLSESKECKKNQTSLKLDHLAGNKQENVENVVGCKQEAAEEEMWQSEEDIKSVRKKRLDARTFRKIIGPKIKDARNSGDGRHTKGENRLLQSKGTSHLIVGKDFVDDSNCRKVENLKDMHPNEEGCVAAEFSSCGSDDGEREYANRSRKQELHFEKVQDLESSERPSSTSDCPLLPIAFDGIEARDAREVKNNEMARLSGLSKDTPPAIGLISAGQVTAECHVSEEKDITDMDYDVSATASSTKTCMDKASVSSSLRIQNEDFVDLCSACAKPKRINTVPEIQNTISFCDGKCHPTKSSYCQDSVCGISGHEGQHDEQCHIVEEEESVLDNHDNENNTCAKCELGGKLLCCDGKGCVKSYHLSCLDPPLSLVPLGAWFCQACVVKKIKLGIYSVSPGMEVICDSAESYNEGKLEKQYFVKYKGLAHVHNRWVPERQLCEESPALIDKFKKRGRKNKALSWSSDWLVPQRLLKKRVIKLLKGAEPLTEESPEITNLPCEWLVKWKGLGYEGITWELDNTPLFTSLEAILLKSDYEQRMRRAKEYSNHKRFEKILNSSKGPLPTALELPGIASGELVKEYLTSVNKILEFWYRCQNAIVIDDKERIVKIVLFILSLKSYVRFPMLVISASPYLVQWEAAFMQFDQSLNVVVYAGDKNVRSNIQMLEFYEDGGGVMLEVLLSTPEAILEDLDSLKHIDCWGVIVVDVSYGSKMSEYLEQIRNLPSDFKLLLASDQIKDDLQELFNILSFLGEENIEHVDQSDNAVELAIFKEKLTQLVAYENNTAQPKLLEYWVPIPLSNVQLEQYCCILVENFFLLRSCLKNDLVGILSDVLKSARKCCEHPYLVNPTLQTALTKGLPELEYLRVGVNSSGKLEFLDRILFEMKNQGQRVLILFPTVIGAEKISVGNILDDFMRQRFGEETYERVDFGVVKGRRDTALNKFNNIKQGRFVFLLEIRACRSCIKLCSVDAVIIFGSEWNPIIDLKALMRIHIDSRSEQLKVFRLYTPFTLEEKLLLLANEDGASPDSNLQNISPATCHALLTWGASYLFQKLDEFHDPSKLETTSEAYSCCVDLNDVVSEVLVDTHKNTSMKETVKQLLTEVEYNGTTYTLKGSLVGVADMQGEDDDVPSTFFWCSLLEGRSPQWKYLPATSQRARKKTMYYIDEATEIGRDGIRKKRQKSGSSTVEPVSLKIWNEERKKALFWQKEDSYPSFFSSPKETTTNLGGPEKEEAFVSKVDDRTRDMHGSDSTPGSISTVSENALVHLVESEGSRNLRDAQRALHIQLKPVLSQLCHIFRLPDNVKDMAEMLLEYIMNTHHINREAKRILDAFLLSLCWTAASLTRHKVNHDESFLLAKNLLGFECKEQEAESVYSKLKSLKKKFVKETRLTEITTDSNSQEKQPRADIDQFLAKETGGLSTGHQDVGETGVRASVSEQIIVDNLHVYGGATEDVGQKGDSKHSPDLDTGGDSEQAHVWNETCDQIELICKARNEEIEKRQRDEIKHFNDIREGLMENLKSKYGLSVCFSSKFEKLVWHMDKCFGKLTDKQREAREMERRLKARWLQDARAGSLVQSFDGIPLSETQFNLEELRISAESIVCEDCEDIVSTSGTSGPTVESGNSSMLNHNTCQVPSVRHVHASAGFAECVDAPGQECSTVSLVEPHAVSMGVPLLVGSPQRDAERAMVSHVLLSDSQAVPMSVSHSVDQPTAQFQHSGRSQVPPEIRANTVAAGVMSEFSNHPQQTPALNATTHGPQLFSTDSLQNELEKIHRQKEIATRITDDEKKRLSKEWEKEVEEINKKYKSLIQDADVRLQKTNETLDLNSRRVFLSRILAEAYKYKSAGPKVPLQAAQGISHTAQQLSSITSSVLPTSHSEVRVVGSAPPRQVVQHSSALFSGDPLSQQLPVISRTSLQVGADMRATPPHLQMHRPSSTTESIPSSLFTGPLLTQMDDHTRSTAQNLVPTPSDPLLLSNASFDAWLTSQKGQASSRPFARAMGGSRETHGDNVVCLSDGE